MDKNRDLITEFIESHAHANIFQSREMFEIYEKTKNYEPVFVSLEDNGEVQATLFAVIQKEYSGLLGIFTARSIIWGGPLIKNNDPVILDRILKKYNAKVKDKAIYSQFRNLWEFTSAEKEVFAKNGFYYEDHLDILHDLTIPVDDQLKKMHAGRRKNIGRAERLNLVLNEINNKEEYIQSFDLVKDTYDRIKLPMPDKSFFMEAYDALNKKGILKTFVLRHEGEIISTRMVLCYKDLIYDWYAGSADKHLDKYPNDYLPWMIMKWGSENKYHFFDFGGAGKPNVAYGVRDYKLKFGGELVSFGRFEKIHKAMLYEMAKLGLAAYKRFKR